MYQQLFVSPLPSCDAASSVLWQDFTTCLSFCFILFYFIFTLEQQNSLHYKSFFLINEPKVCFWSLDLVNHLYFKIPENFVSFSTTDFDLCVVIIIIIIVIIIIDQTPSKANSTRSLIQSHLIVTRCNILTFQYLTLIYSSCRWHFLPNLYISLSH